MLWERTEQGGEIPEPDQFEDQYLPVLGFLGLVRETIVSHEHTGPVEGIVRLVANFMGKKLDLLTSMGSGRNRPEAFRTVSFREFLRDHPHPLPAKTPYCLDRNGATASWFDGARFCVHCRDRLALATALDGSPAVRLVPLRT